MSQGADSWQAIFLVGAALFIALQAWRGWRLGVVRQLLSIVAIAAAYAAAILGGRLLVPLLRPLGFPDQLLAIGGGAVLGLGAYAAVTLVSGVLFKRTSQQSVGMVRLGYGAFGALLGVGLGVFMVWVAVLAVRVLGTVAETELAAAQRPAGRAVERSLRTEPSALASGLAHLKQSLERGATGSVVERVDPIPGWAYALLASIGEMISNPESIERFLAYPGVKKLSQHPKIIALQADPEIVRDALGRDYVALMRNDRIVAAANDPELGVMLRELEFQKALDHALRRPPSRRPAVD